MHIIAMIRQRLVANFDSEKVSVAHKPGWVSIVFNSCDQLV